VTTLTSFTVSPISKYTGKTSRQLRTKDTAVSFNLTQLNKHKRGQYIQWHERKRVKQHVWANWL